MPRSALLRCAVLGAQASCQQKRSLETGSGAGCLWLPQGLPHEVPCVQGVCSGGWVTQTCLSSPRRLRT